MTSTVHALVGRWRATAPFAFVLVLASAPARADDTPSLPSWTSGPDASSGGAEVAPFVLDLGTETGRRAVSCLTDAVYYEAATEPRAGQEAVAQVVLNRVRHPAFPKSVCAVVYQGVGSSAACQFSFACDGSLARAPVQDLWRSAEAVAEAALSGHVAASAGSSTHYHAGWARPYWRASLVETGRIGSQIFYHMPGRLGSSQALTAAYSGTETVSRPQVALRAPRTRAAPARAPVDNDTSVSFSPWGLNVATVSRERGAVSVRTLN